MHKVTYTIHTTFGIGQKEMEWRISSESVIFSDTY
jgi:hypothetical protein